jgi:ABC-2 type transport system ATP-binding protein
LYDNLTLEENLMFFARLSGVPDPAARIGTALAAMDSTGHDQERMSTFSKGIRQRAGLAQAILNEPAVLFLDEPTSGLDPQGVAQLRQIIIGLNQDLGMTVFMNTHLLAEVTRTCTSIGILSRPADLPRTPSTNTASTAPQPTKSGSASKPPRPVHARHRTTKGTGEKID